MARSLVKAKELPNQYRAEAIATSVYLLNISPTKAILNQTPYEAWREMYPSMKKQGGIGIAAVMGFSLKI